MSCFGCLLQILDYAKEAALGNSKAKPDANSDDLQQWRVNGCTRKLSLRCVSSSTPRESWDYEGITIRDDNGSDWARVDQMNTTPPNDCDVPHDTWALRRYTPLGHLHVTLFRTRLVFQSGLCSLTASPHDCYVFRTVAIMDFILPQSSISPGPREARAI
ncbi:hypothetical protein V6N12_038156 [Hibiscus sabdariffa]|uniref:Uncharacterized protein n=1 Tax=Hibiscus sabdariffa TaxID=183260 RepID=A0ABR2BX83_9ROSI